VAAQLCWADLGDFLMKILEPEYSQFVTFTTFQREPYFKNVSLRNLFLETLEEIRAKYSYEIWAYVVMKDHIHMAVFPKQTLPIEKFLYSVKKTSGYRCNKFLFNQTETALPAKPHPCIKGFGKAMEVSVEACIIRKHFGQ